jgi:HK97 family phage major capsid protein
MLATKTQLGEVRRVKTSLERKVDELNKTYRSRGRLSAPEDDDLKAAHKTIAGAENYLRAANAHGLATGPDPDAALRRFAFAELLRSIATTGKGDDPKRALSRELRAALNITTGTQGGYLVPPEFDDEVVYVNTDFAPVEALASHFNSVTHGPLTIAGATVEPTAALLSEGGAYGESEPTLAGYTENGFKYGFMSKLSDELFHSPSVDIVNLLAISGGRGVQVALDNAFVNGSGTGAPQGLVNNSVGYTLPTGNATSITYNGLDELYFSLAPGYRANASWLLADSTLKIIHELTDSAGRPVLKFPEGDETQTPTLLGRPVYSDQSWPVMAANAAPVYFGDVSSNYLVRRIETTVKIVTELYGANGQLGCRIDRRADGRIVDPAAARLLKNSAT